MDINVLVLAYLGDTIYEDYIREYLIRKGINNVNTLQNEATKYVSANSQHKILKKLMDENYFTDEELTIIKRGRNHKNNNHHKNCNIIHYRNATGFEALIGYLKINNNIKRIEEIMNKVIE